METRILAQKLLQLNRPNVTREIVANGLMEDINSIIDSLNNQAYCESIISNNRFGVKEHFTAKIDSVLNKLNLFYHETQKQNQAEKTADAFQMQFTNSLMEDEPLTFSNLSDVVKLFLSNLREELRNLKNSQTIGESSFGGYRSKDCINKVRDSVKDVFAVLDIIEAFLGLDEVENISEESSESSRTIEEILKNLKYPSKEEEEVEDFSSLELSEEDMTTYLEYFNEKEDFSVEDFKLFMDLTHVNEGVINENEELAELCQKISDRLGDTE